MATGNYYNEVGWYIEGTTGSDSLTANNCHNCQAVGLGGSDHVTLNSCNNNELGFVAGWDNVQYDHTSKLYDVELYVKNNITDIKVSQWLERRPSGSGDNILNLNVSNNNVALMGDGRNTVEIYKSYNNQIRVGNGNNIFTVKSGDKNILVAGYGANDVTISDGKYNMFAADASLVAKGQKNIVRLTGGSNHFVYTESGDDVIYIEKNAGDSMMVVSGEGNDTISVSAGNKHLIWASYTKDDKGNEYILKGNNTISLTNTNENTIVTGDGADKLVINNADVIEADLGSGKDEIVMTNTNGKKSNGVLSKIHGGAWGDTFTVKDGVQNYQLYGDAGNDVFNISSGNNINFWGGAANDTFNVTGGNNNKLYGGDSADTFNISAGNQNMTLGYGNDIVNVTAGNNQKIKANLGINTINLKAGSGHVITADIDKALSKKNGYTDEQIKNGEGLGYGQDKVYISGTASSVTANLGDGRDYVSVSSESGHRIYTEGWTDTIEVSGSTRDSLFDAGDGNDIINVSGGTNNSFYAGTGDDIVTVETGEKLTVNGGLGNDTFYIKGGSGIYAGESGNDTYVVDWKGILSNKIVIDNGQNAGVGDNDTLVLNGLSRKDIKFSMAGNSLLITDKEGKFMTIDGWTSNALSVVKFADANITGDEINNLLNRVKSYVDGTIYNDIITVGEGKAIVNGNSYAVLNKDISIESSAGDDEIKINGITSSDVWASDGNDIVYVNGGWDNFIECGKGNDTVIIDWRKTESVSGAIVDGEVEIPIIAMNESEDMAYYGSDKLVIQNSNIDNFNYRIVNYKRVPNEENDYDVVWNAGTQQALVITDKNDKNKNIVIFNWDKNPLSSITIGSSFLTTADINKLFESAERVNKEHGDWNGSTGDDNIIFTGSNNILYASSGNDKLLVNGNNNTINAGSGKNEITVKSNRGSETINGEEAVNVINVDGAKSVTVKCGFTITEEELLAYEEGTLTGAAKEKIERYWNGTLEGDTVTVKDTKEINISGGAGNDKLVLSGFDADSRIEVSDADDGNDYIEVSKAGFADIAGGNGDDQYVIDWSTVKAATIRNSNDPWPEPDHWADVETSIKQENDTLVLKNVSYSDVKISWVKGYYQYNDQSVTEVVRIQDKNNSTHYVDIAFWNENNMASVKFDDRILTAADINKMLNNNLTRSYNSSSVSDAYNAMTSFSDTSILGDNGTSYFGVQTSDNNERNLIITGNV